MKVMKGNHLPLMYSILLVFCIEIVQPVRLGLSGLAKPNQTLGPELRSSSLDSGVVRKQNTAVSCLLIPFLGPKYFIMEE